MQSCRALLLDLSGVLYEGSKVIDGAADVVRRARQRGLILRFVTNTATKPAAAIIEQLAGMDITIDKEELFTAPIAAIRYVEQQQLRPYCLVHRALRDEFAHLDRHDPNCVVLGDARDDLTYDALNHAFRLCIEGAPLIGIGMNKYFKDDDGLKLDAGAFIHAIEWAAGVEATIMGKPGAAFFQQVVASTGCRADDCLMVGDDVQSDVIGAVDAGLRGCLVRTGKFRAGDERQLPKGAEIIDSIADLIPAT